MRRLVIASILWLGFFSLSAQDELKKIIPPSPTVSSLAKYGEIPISYYTGSPNVSVPIYVIKTNDFSLPISISYHTSGIKVEEMASWVGLGWSLNAGGIISRSQRGGPDEISGYMIMEDKIVDYASMPPAEFEEIAREWYASPSSMPDGEADMFSYNFGGNSGQFYYNQNTEKFVCVPQTTIKFDKAYFLTTGKWRLTLENGAEYYFELKEQNTNYSDCGGYASAPTTTTTGWFLTKIVTPVAKEEIIFNYVSATYTIRNIGSQTLNAGLWPNGLPDCAGASKVTCNSYSDYNGYRLSSIEYSRGRIEFIADSERVDLINDKRLDRIRIYNFSDTEPCKEFRFSYSYFNNSIIQSWSGASSDLSNLVRLKLESVTEFGIEGDSLPPTRFVYNETYPLPSRLSYDQDNWGFYNGPNGNNDLIPPVIMGNLNLSGANRTTNDTYTGLGSLIKIEYPTGGSTSMEFENNTVWGYIPFGNYSNLAPKLAYLDVTDSADVTNHIFYEQIEINDYRRDGIWLSVEVEGILNCEHCPVATSCAVMSLESSNFSLPITCNVENVFVPNGTYVLKGDFSGSSDPDDFAEFIIRLNWSEFTAFEGETKVGGLRIKKITQNDALGHSMVTKFDYSADGKSSGVVAHDNPVYEYPHYCRTLNGGNGADGFYMVRTSYSNLPVAQTQGSPVGYGKVTVTRGDSTTNGKSVYYYTKPSDYIDEFGLSSYFPSEYNVLSFPSTGNTTFPFPPATSYEHRRGLLLRQEDYIGDDSSSLLLKSVDYRYEPLTDVHPDSALLYDQTLSVKLGALLTTSGSSSYDYPAFTFYKTISEWPRQVEATERFYDAYGVVNFETVTTTEYGNPIHMKPTATTTRLSDSTIQVSYNRYAQDYILPSVIPSEDSVSLAVKLLQDGNFAGTLIESYITILKPGDTTPKLTKGVITTYHHDVPVPRDVFVLALPNNVPLTTFNVSTVDSSGVFLMDSLYQRRIVFQKFDSLGNLLEQKKDADVTTTYLWAYNSSYPIAEVINARYDEVFYTSFEEDSLNVSTDAKTGFKSRNTSYTLNVPTERKLTYWERVGSNPWHEVETVVNGQIVIGGANKLIDEVRVYPSNAQMTTYTYRPGWGVSSVTDQNNRTSYYEYDNFNRLKLIKDDKGNILKTFTYNYKTTGSGQ